MRLAEKVVKEEDNFFVGIENPLDLRRQLLEASKKMVEVLKRYEKFKEKRSEKAIQTEKLKKTMNEIARLNLKLKGIMPKTSLRVPHEMQGAPVIDVKAKVLVQKEPATEIERLELELGDIEKKLAKLG